MAKVSTSRYWLLIVMLFAALSFSYLMKSGLVFGWNTFGSNEITSSEYVRLWLDEAVGKVKRDSVRILLKTSSQEPANLEAKYACNLSARPINDFSAILPRIQSVEPYKTNGCSVDIVEKGGTYLVFNVPLTVAVLYFLTSAGGFWFLKRRLK